MRKGRDFHSGALVLGFFRIFSKNIPDSRIGLFLGMESGGDVKFYSPGAPV